MWYAGAEVFDGQGNTVDPSRWKIYRTGAVSGEPGFPIPGEPIDDYPLPPTIIEQPESASVLLGGSRTFDVTAFGSAPFAYQWQFNNADIPGATSSSLTLDNLTLANQGSYRVLVRNPYGSQYSDPATLTVALTHTLGLYDSGVGADRLPLADGQPDLHYQLRVNPDGTDQIPAMVQDSLVFPLVAGPWVANSATSKWVGPRPNTSGAAGETVDHGAGAGVYVYRTTVDLTGYAPAGITITGNWATDNVGLDIKVNEGNPLVADSSTGQTNQAEFTAFTGFTLNKSNSTFVNGVNTIDFHVKNSGPGAGYTGLRISGLTASVASGSLASWKTVNAPGQADEEDADGDGLTTFWEYVGGGIPGEGDSGRLPTAATESFTVDGVAAEYPTLNATLRRDIPDVQLFPESGADFSTWAADMVFVRRTENADGTDTWTWRHTHPLGGLSRVFMRLRALVP